jgi:hypothetical protein
MNLQEQLNRIQEMMGTINESKRLKILENELDEIFNNLTIERLFPNEPKLISYKWLDNDGNKVFEKNHWGMFFIQEFDFIKPIKSLVNNFLSLTNEEYEKTLINYLNTRYKEEFENRPILDIDKSIRFFDDDDAW